ncbi:hypothetical protein BROUX41_005222 [Berkeleyomyces rouxiae]|uniref:uncharacterized protein n=1 Tax=Berkeleyomyces rouxiae TaxID=2035830 RepID=UPI003B7CCBCF
MASTNLVADPQHPRPRASSSASQHPPADGGRIDPNLLSPNHNPALTTPTLNPQSFDDSPYCDSIYQPSMSDMLSDDLSDLSGINFDDPQSHDFPFFTDKSCSNACTAEPNLQSMPTHDFHSTSASTSNDTARGRSAVVSTGLLAARAPQFPSQPQLPPQTVANAIHKVDIPATNQNILPLAPESPSVRVEVWDHDSGVCVPHNNAQPTSLNRDCSPARSFASDVATYQDDMSAIYTAGQTEGTGSLHGQWKFPQASWARSGVAPSERTQGITESINDLQRNRHVRERNQSVSQWLQHEIPNDSPSEIDPAVSITQEEADLANATIPLGNMTENKIISDQTYIDPNSGHLDPTDVKIIRDRPAWEDGPRFHAIDSKTRSAPQTSNDAMALYRQQILFNNESVLSLAATVGTTNQRQSFSDPIDPEHGEFLNGSFFKRLSIHNGHSRSRSVSSVFQGLQNITSMIRTPSTGGNTKRRMRLDDDESSGSGSGTPVEADGRSRSSLNITRPLIQKRGSHSISTLVANVGGSAAAIGSTHTRHGSITSPPITSPKGSFTGLMPSRRHRNRSKSDAGRSSMSSGLVNLLRRNGGPPVATLGTPTPLAPAESLLPCQVPAEVSVVANMSCDDTSDDDEGDEGDDEEISGSMGDSTDIVPNMDGFRDQFRKLNPDILPKNEFLVDRISHHQVQRYKTLLENHIKHIKQAGKCANGKNCANQGGMVTLLNSKGKPRSSNALDDTMASTNIVTVTEQSFPMGIPRPVAETLPAAFECQLCFRKKTYVKPSDWTKHVQEDIQPFTCTWDGCKDPKMFKRKADWVRHENEGHRHLEWWTCNITECTHTCYRRDNFLQHLVREHKFPDPEHKSKAKVRQHGANDATTQRVEICHHETPNRPDDEPCRFCNKTFSTWKKLTVHLAKHMEQISLPVIPLAERTDLNADTIISPLQDLPPRPFPAMLSPEEVAATFGELDGRMNGNIASQKQQKQQQFQQQQHEMDPRQFNYMSTGSIGTTAQFPTTSQTAFVFPHTTTMPQNGFPAELVTSFSPGSLTMGAISTPNAPFLMGGQVTAQTPQSAAQAGMHSFAPVVSPEASVFDSGFMPQTLPVQQQQSMEQFDDPSNQLGLHAPATGLNFGADAGNIMASQTQYAQNGYMQDVNGQFYPGM